MAQAFSFNTSELLDHYKKALQSGDRFTLSVIKTKRLFMSRNSKKGAHTKKFNPRTFASVGWL